ncbi:competence protein CoiA family protein [Photobacterium leiognathi]|uniref:hypothetical protein n=1 Tax=Photobacterium leiognathi TaxID=553611 RepID=UPI002981FE55|nr:hypothetical protein [Photobacterium leiognathi]
MEFAQDNKGKLVHIKFAIPNKEYACPVCKETVIAHNGERFKHKGIACSESTHMHWLAIPSIDFAKELNLNDFEFLRKRLNYNSLTLSEQDEQAKNNLITMGLLHEIEVKPKRLKETIFKLREINPNLCTIEGEFCPELQRIIDALAPITHQDSRSIKPSKIRSSRLNDRVRHFLFTNCLNSQQLLAANDFWIKAYCKKVNQHAPPAVQSLVEQRISNEKSKNLAVIALDKNVVQLVTTTRSIPSYMLNLNKKLADSKTQVKLLASANGGGYLREVLIKHRIRQPTLDRKADSVLYHSDYGEVVAKAVNELTTRSK